MLRDWPNAPPATYQVVRCEIHPKLGQIQQLLMRRRLSGDFCFAKGGTVSAFDHPYRANSRTLVDESGRKWVLQTDTLDGSIHVATNCPCGCTLQTSVSSLSRVLEVSSGLLCELPRDEQIKFLRVPKELADEAIERAQKHSDRCCQTRHAAGGDGSWYPL